MVMCKGVYCCFYRSWLHYLTRFRWSWTFTPRIQWCSADVRIRPSAIKCTRNKWLNLKRNFWQTYAGCQNMVAYQYSAISSVAFFKVIVIRKLTAFFAITHNAWTQKRHFVVPLHNNMPQYICLKTSAKSKMFLTLSQIWKMSPLFPLAPQC